MDPLDLDPDEIQIADIAHALSLQCRFGGHCAHFYSVAEHCLLVSALCPPQASLWGLLHDAGEAYLMDLPAPLKDPQHPLGEQYRRAEETIMNAIADRLCLPLPMPSEVHKADQLAFAAEWRQLMPASAVPLQIAERPSINLDLLAPADAERLFLDRFAQLT